MESMNSIDFQLILHGIHGMLAQNLEQQFSFFQRRKQNRRATHTKTTMFVSFDFGPTPRTHLGLSTKSLAQRSQKWLAGKRCGPSPHRHICLSAWPGGGRGGPRGHPASGERIALKSRLPGHPTRASLMFPRSSQHPQPTVAPLAIATQCLHCCQLQLSSPKSTRRV